MSNNCGYCEKLVSHLTKSKLLCGLCGNMFHLQCTKISKNQFKMMSNDNKSSWMCISCINIFPYNHVVDNNNFVELVTNNDARLLQLCCDQLLFDPCDFYSGNNEIIPCNDYDPDLHYYNPSRNIDSRYYDIA